MTAPMKAAEPAAAIREPALGALAGGYRGVTALVTGLDEADFMRPSRCAGWAVVDVLYHLLCDAQRALVALATPTDARADTDFITYWRYFAGGPAPSLAAARQARSTRIAAASWDRPAALVALWQETTEAAVRAAAAVPANSRLTTQGHVLALPDLLASFAVEAAVHHLDMTLDLPDAAEPDADALALTRRTLDGVLGSGTVRPSWSDPEYALKGTGRLGLDAAERRLLGASADQFPLFG